MANDRSRIRRCDRFFALSRDLLCIVGFDGTLRCVNPALERIVGRPAADLVGTSFLDLIDPDDRAAVAGIFQPREGVASARTIETRFLGADGAYHRVEWSVQQDPDTAENYAVGRAVSDRGREANLAFLAGVLDDLARITSAEDIMRAVGEKLARFLHVDFCFFAEVDEANDEVRIEYLWHTEDVPGTPSVIPLSSILKRGELSDAFPVAEMIVVRDTETDARLKPEVYRAMKMRSVIALPFVRHGRWQTTIAIAAAHPRDWREDEIDLVRNLMIRVFPQIEHVRAEAALRASEERLQLALDASAMGTFVWYPEEDRGEPDARMLALFGQPADGTLTLKAALASMIHPDDRARYAAAVTQAMDPTGSRMLQEDVRVVLPDATIRWVTVYGQVYFEGDPPRAARMPGMAIDITERKRIEEEVRRAAELNSFRAAFTDALRPLAETAQIQKEATRVVAEWLGVSRALYIDIDETAGCYAIEREFHAANVPSLLGHYRFQDVDPALLASLRAGQTHAVADVRTAPLLTDEKRSAYVAVGTLAFVDVPLVKDGRLDSLLTVQSAVPRDWNAADISLVEEAAERTWAAVTRARSEQALRESEERYRTLYETIDEGFVASEVIEDETGRIVDYRILEINPAYAKMSGVAEDRIVGKRVRELLPDLEPFWFETIQAVITRREGIRVERLVPELGKWFDCYFAPAGGMNHERFVAVFTDTTQRKQVEEERERARQEAEAAVRARDEFLSIASHELRNPVAAVKATAQLMRRLLVRKRLDERRLDRYTQTLDETSDRLATLVEDLLDVSRLQSGQLSVRTEPVDLAALVKRAVEIERIAAQGHRLRLAVDEGRTLMLDPERIKQVIVNLLDNAIKYSPGGGEVRIALCDEAGGALLRVQDQGIGLPPEALESVFEPFGRALNATRGHIPGMGLGLYIARRIVQAHGGKLWAESEGEGRGTTMCLWLPGEDDPV